LGVVVAGVGEESAGRSDRLLHLPKGSSAIEPKRVQRADFRERRDFVAAEATSSNELVECIEPIGGWRLAIGDWSADWQRPQMRANVAKTFMCMEPFEH